MPTRCCPARQRTHCPPPAWPQSAPRACPGCRCPGYTVRGSKPRGGVLGITVAHWHTEACCTRLTRQLSSGIPPLLPSQPSSNLPHLQEPGSPIHVWAAPYPPPSPLYLSSLHPTYPTCRNQAVCSIVSLPCKMTTPSTDALESCRRVACATLIQNSAGGRGEGRGCSSHFTGGGAAVHLSLGGGSVLLVQSISYSRWP